MKISPASGTGTGYLYLLLVSYPVQPYRYRYPVPVPVPLNYYRMATWYGYRTDYLHPRPGRDT